MFNTEIAEFDKFEHIHYVYQSPIIRTNTMKLKICPATKLSKSFKQALLKHPP